MLKSRRRTCWKEWGWYAMQVSYKQRILRERGAREGTRVGRRRRRETKEEDQRGRVNLRLI